MSHPESAPDTDALEGLDVPDGLSPDAVDLIADVVESRELDAVEFQSLLQAARLVSLADRCEAEVTDVVSVGSQGQPVAHPLIGEARSCRVAALAALRALGLAPGQSSASAAGAALVAQRWSGRSQRRAVTGR